MTDARYRRRPEPVVRFSRLEREVMAALTWELRSEAPDLAGQFEEALPGHRRNTGDGFQHEIIVDRKRPSRPSRSAASSARCTP